MIEIIIRACMEIKTWVYNPNTSATSSKTWKDSIGYTAQDLSELMKDLKFDDTK
jgi:hypothetical protein